MYALREGERLRREGVLPPINPPLTLEEAFLEKDFIEGKFEVVDRRKDRLNRHLYNQTTIIGVLDSKYTTQIDTLDTGLTNRRYLNPITTMNTTEVKSGWKVEDMLMTIWDVEKLIAFKSRHARKENGNVVIDCINVSPYESQINTYEVNQ